MPRRFHIAKGLDLPITGEPQQAIDDGPPIRTVALVADDYLGLRPSMEVQEGDRVRLGQVLVTDKGLPGVRHTAPGCGTVAAINRGAKRKFESLVIELDGDEEETFETFADRHLASLDRQIVCDQLLASGLWTALRSRPFSKVPDPTTVPHALFITAIDTNPVAADPAVVLAGREVDFTAGLETLSTLAEGKTYLCIAPGAEIPGKDVNSIEVVEFAGPHPAGLPGTHIHFLSPASDRRAAWYINYQDVAAIGRLMITGRLATERVVSLAGPAAERPRLVRTRLGASLKDLTSGEYAITERGTRIVSGSVLSGRQFAPMREHLGRHHLQVSLVPEGGDRELMGWAGPGGRKFSVKRTFAAAWTAGISGRRYPMTTSTEGSHRAIVPIGAYESVMPLDMLATPLLKAVVTEDTELSQALGCLELDEEDLALCTFVCPSKNDYGPYLRRVLTRIEREG